jgi:hypothetical protein
VLPPVQPPLPGSHLSSSHAASLYAPHQLMPQPFAVQESYFSYSVSAPPEAGGDYQHQQFPQLVTHNFPQHPLPVVVGSHSAAHGGPPQGAFYQALQPPLPHSYREASQHLSTLQASPSFQQAGQQHTAHYPYGSMTT